MLFTKDILYLKTQVGIKDIHVSSTQRYIPIHSHQTIQTLRQKFIARDKEKYFTKTKGSINPAARCL